jgi:hypothetical protein
MSRGSFTARGFEVRLTSGPDEWEIGVDNDSYMNMACAKALEAALAAADLYGFGSEPELESWQAARDSFLYPFSIGKPTSLLSSEGAPCNGPGAPEHLVCNRSNYQVGMVAYMWAHAIPSDINASVLHATWALEEKLRQIEPLCPKDKGGQGKTSLVRAILDKTEHLPRQARDDHHEKDSFSRRAVVLFKRADDRVDPWLHRAAFYCNGGTL